MGSIFIQGGLHGVYSTILADVAVLSHHPFDGMFFRPRQRMKVRSETWTELFNLDRIVPSRSNPFLTLLCSNALMRKHRSQSIFRQVDGGFDAFIRVVEFD